MFEQSKATKRRFQDGNFNNRYFNGNGINIKKANVHKRILEKSITSLIYTK